MSEDGSSACGLRRFWPGSFRLRRFSMLTVHRSVCYVPTCFAPLWDFFRQILTDLLPSETQRADFVAPNSTPAIYGAPAIYGEPAI
jgi:hypothetical protein